MQRIRSLAHGERDRMIEVSGLSRGDTALDATLGLGIDSLVMSHVVGPEGRVIGIESSWYLARLLELVKHPPPETYQEVSGLLARVENICRITALMLLFSIRCFAFLRNRPLT